MAFLIQNTRTDDFIADVSGGWPDWTPVRSFAKRFSTRQEAEQFIAKNQVKGDDPYMKVVKEMKGLKEFIKSKPIKEANNIKMHRDIDDVDVIIEPDGSYTFWKDHGKTKGAQNRSLHGQEGAVKELGALGYEVVKEAARVNDRIFPDAGEISVVSKTGAYGISIFIDSRERVNTPDGKTKLHWNISTTYDGPYNAEANKYSYIDSDEDIEKVIKKHADEFKNVIKRGIERLDDDIEALAKKLGYK